GGARGHKECAAGVPATKAAPARLVARYGRADVAAMCGALERGMTERKGILPNLDCPSAPAYHRMGFDTPTFTPLFVAARVTGWTAHVMEQLDSNALIRPLSHYDGPDERHVP